MGGESAWRGSFRSRKTQSSIHRASLARTLHGSLEKKRFIALLRRAMEQKATNYPRRLWLVVPEGTALEMKEMLAAELMGIRRNRTGERDPMDMPFEFGVTQEMLRPL